MVASQIPLRWQEQDAIAGNLSQSFVEPQCKRHLPPDLFHRIPAGVLYGGGDKKVTDVRFTELFFVDVIQNRPRYAAVFS